jgi:hypothetical protein
MGQPTPAPVHDTPPLQASHAEAQRLQHMARHAIDAFTLQRVMIGVCALLERMTAEPQAPAHVVNPTVQQQAVQLYNTLRNQSVIIDTRQAVVVAVGLLLQVVRDAGESENSH